jgi:hypothetical protein
MTTVFIICAALGSAILIIQLVMLLMGFGFDHDVGDGHAFDFGGDHDASFGDQHFELGGDHDAGAIGDHDIGGDTHLDAAHDHDVHEHGSSWFFSVLSVRSVVAALAFFGLAGLAMDAGGAPIYITIVIACGAGAVAMVIVAWLMRLMYSLNAEGNVHIELAVGLPASVYLRVPGKRSGTGKVTVKVQDRTMEYLAMTDGGALPTGVPVMVVGVIGPDTLEVAPIQEGKEKT